MDLKSLTPSKDTIEVIIKDPRDMEKPFLNDDGTEMTIEVYAPHTKQYKQAIYAQASVRMKMDKDDLDFEALDNASVELLAGITKSWDITYDGKKPKMDTKKAKEVYSEIFWLKAQVEEALNTFEVFTQD